MNCIDNIVIYHQNNNLLSSHKQKIDKIISKTNNNSTNKKYKLYNDLFDNKLTDNNIIVKIMTMKQEIFYLENIFVRDCFLNYYHTKMDDKIFIKKKTINKKKNILKKKKINNQIKINIKIEIINLIQDCINLYLKKIKFLKKNYYLSY